MLPFRKKRMKGGIKVRKLEKEIKKLLESVQVLAKENKARICITVFDDGQGWADGDKFRTIDIGYREPKDRAVLER